MKTLRFIITLREKKTRFFNVNTRNKLKSVSVSLSRSVSFGVCLHIQYFFDMVRNQLQTISIY